LSCKNKAVLYVLILILINSLQP